jgi:hypothetical protein
LSEGRRRGILTPSLGQSRIQTASKSNQPRAKRAEIVDDLSPPVGLKGHWHLELIGNGTDAPFGTGFVKMTAPGRLSQNPFLRTILVLIAEPTWVEPFTLIFLGVAPPTLTVHPEAANFSTSQMIASPSTTALTITGASPGGGAAA